MARRSTTYVPVVLTRRGVIVAVALFVVLAVAAALHVASGPGVHTSTVVMSVATLALVALMLRAER